MSKTYTSILESWQIIVVLLILATIVLLLLLDIRMDSNGLF